MRTALTLIVLLAAGTVLQAGPTRGFTSTTIFGNTETDDFLPSTFYEPLGPTTKPKSTVTQPKPKVKTEVVVRQKTNPRVASQKIDVTPAARDTRKIAAPTERLDKTTTPKFLDAKTAYAKALLDQIGKDPMSAKVRGTTITMDTFTRPKSRRHAFAEWP